MNRLLLMALLAVSGGALALVAAQGGGGPSGFATGNLGTPMSIWTYPTNDAEGVSMSWEGKDAPQPSAPPAGYPSGPVLTLQVGGGVVLTVDEARVVTEPSGSLVDATILTGDNDSVLDAHTVAVIPHAPLEPSTTYTVEVRGKADGIPFEEIWSFTTRREGCDLLDQDCGPGRACSILSTGKQCLWSGRGLVGERCEHANHCGSGLMCMSGRCLPFCDSREESNDPSIACAGRCPGGIFDVPGADTDEPARLCVLESCIKNASLCTEGEGCFWLGGFLCATAGTGKAGASCALASDCSAGTSCLGHEGAFACRALCGGDGMPACLDACGDQALLFDGDNMISFCP
jgi:hypothetical protein